MDAEQVIETAEPDQPHVAGRQVDSLGDPVVSKRRKTALILSGGGARGAYEVGVVRALVERGRQFDLVLGTSIGAINAAFFAQGDLERWERMWCGLHTKDVFRPLSLLQIFQVLRGKSLGLLDTAPLEQLLRRELNLEKIKSGGMEAGWCMTDLCTQETELVLARDLNNADELVDTLMATSAVPLLFPPREACGKGLYLDGGLVRNTPLKFALDMGIEEIYAVLLNGNVTAARPAHMLDCSARILDVVLDSSAKNAIAFAHFYNSALAKNAADAAGGNTLAVHVFKPAISLSKNILNFNPEQAKALIVQGYEDTHKYLANLPSVKENPGGQHVEQHWF